MYEYIEGEIDQLTPTHAVIGAGGVGYLLPISLNTYAALEGKATARLYTHFIVREDAQILYGFSSPEEREVFRLLLAVSGVGGNTARMILSRFTASEVCTIVGTGAADQLKTVKGLGLKTAQKIIVELRDKISGSLASLDLPALEATPSPAQEERKGEVLAALTTLGFARNASEKVLQTLLTEHPEASVEELIRMTLKKM